MREKITKTIKYFIPSFIVTFILLFLYLIKGIYPFGSMTIVQGDLFQMFTPFYMNLWDAFHNGYSLLYEYNVGTGRKHFRVVCSFWRI